MRQCNLTIYYQNVRGLRTETLELYESILAEDYDIIALTETWLEPDIANNNYLIQDMKYFVKTEIR